MGFNSGFKGLKIPNMKFYENPSGESLVVYWERTGGKTQRR